MKFTPLLVCFLLASILLMGCTDSPTYYINNAKLSKFFDVNIVGSQGQVPFISADGNALEVETGFDYNKDTNTLSVDFINASIDHNELEGLQWSQAGHTINTAVDFANNDLYNVDDVNTVQMDITINSDSTNAFRVLDSDGNTFIRISPQYYSMGFLAGTASGLYGFNLVPKNGEDTNITYKGNNGRGVRISSSTGGKSTYVDANNLGGNGGTLFFTAGNGGSQNTVLSSNLLGQQGGNGGGFTMTGGDGGTATTGGGSIYGLYAYGGNGSSFSMTGGDGGGASYALDVRGGAGSDFVIVGGKGGTASYPRTGGSGLSGVGGNVDLRGGDSGNIIGSGVEGVPGNVLLTTGSNYSDYNYGHIGFMQDTSTYFGKMFYSTDNNEWNFSFNGNQSLDGNFFGNQIYGEDYNKDDAGFETINLVNPDEYQRITMLEAGNNNGFSVSDGNLVADFNGLYQANITASVNAGGNSEYGLKLFVNDLGQDNCYTHFHLASGDVKSVSFSCLVRVISGESLNVRIDDHSSPVNDPTIDSFNLNVWRVGN